MVPVGWMYRVNNVPVPQSVLGLTLCGLIDTFPHFDSSICCIYGVRRNGACYERLLIAVFMGVFCGGCSSYCGVDVQGRVTEK